MMSTKMIKRKIINKLNKFEKENWGYACNRIQDVAQSVLNKKEWNAYLKASRDDVEYCDDMDGQYLNGQYFDWREFDSKSIEIIGAYLDYYNDNQLEKILGAM